MSTKSIHRKRLLNLRFDLAEWLPVSSLTTKLVLVTVILTILAALIVSAEVSQHSVDHLDENQRSTAQEVVAGVEIINRDLKAITAYIANVDQVDRKFLEPFVMDLKEQGLCANSLVGIGAKPLSNIDSSEFAFGELSSQDLRDITRSPEFMAAAEFANLTSRPAVSSGFKGVIDEKWLNLVVFVSPIENVNGESYLVYSVHDSEKLVSELIKNDPTTHGIPAFSISVTDLRDGSAIGEVEFRDSREQETLENTSSPASVLNAIWAVRLVAPKNYAQLRYDRAAVFSVLVVGFAVAWILVTAVNAFIRSRESLRRRADYAENLYAEQVGVNARLSTNANVVLNAASDAILLVDKERRIVWINEAFRTLFDVEPGDWTGRHSSELKKFSLDAGSVDLEYHAEIDTIYADNDYSEQSRIMKISKDGGTVYTSRSTTPVTTENGGYTGRLWIYHDVTSVQETADARSRLISVVSHELRTPLTTVRGHIDLLADGLLGEMPSKQTKSVSAASRALTRLGVLIDDLLDLSRLDSESLQIDYEIVSANTLVKNLTEEFRLRFDSLGLTLNTEFGSDGDIWCDPYRYSQIVANLLSNAERYTPEGGTVSVSTEFVGADFVLTVSDTGIGIPATKLDQIFDPFTTVSAVSYKKDGSTGLGLAIVRGLAELHGGNVGVTSTLGTGSSFRVSIPIDSPKL